MNVLQQLSLGRLSFRLRAQEEGRLPWFLGSALRGGMGVSLREVGCPLRCEDPRRCPVGERCAYAYLYETPVPANARHLRKLSTLPHPLVVEPPGSVEDRRGSRQVERGEVLTFSILLVGRALTFFPAVVLAVDRMAGQGLGGQRVPFVLEEVWEDRSPLRGEDRLLWSREAEALQEPWGFELGELPPLRAASRVTVSFQWPLRILERKRLLWKVSFRSFGRALLGRISSLLEFHCHRILDLPFRDLLALAEEARVVEQRLRKVSLKRWSNRQGEHQRLDGVAGTITWEGEAVEALWTALRAGELVHVGKSTVFGLGKYALSPCGEVS